MSIEVNPIEVEDPGSVINAIQMSLLPDGAVFKYLISGQMRTLIKGPADASGYYQCWQIDINESVNGDGTWTVEPYNATLSLDPVIE